MTVPTPDISEIPRKADRTKLLKLLHEREVLGYAFSLKRLVTLLVDAMDSQFATEQAALELIGDCIVAKNDDEEDEIKHKLNADISDLLLANDLTIVRHADPWGTKKDCFIGMRKVPGRFSKELAIKTGAKFFNMSPEQVMTFIDKSTTEPSETATLTVRTVKEKEEKRS